MTRAVIVAARRTPQGRFLGGLARLSACELAQTAAAAALEGIDRAAVDSVIVGNVLGAGLGMNIARQIGVRLGLPMEVPAFTVNMMCASGMKAVMLAADAVQSGAAQAVLCGGTESMSNAPYVLERARAGLKFGDATLVDTLLRDGLVDSFRHEHMGLTAERLAREYEISREQQDDFALASQTRCAAAVAARLFAAELTPAGSLAADEHPRPQTTAADLAKLTPAFEPDGSVTAGNASGINDGAAMLVVASDEAARRHGWPILAAFDAQAAAGCDPQRMGLGPVHATARLLRATSTTVADYDAVELNEAFAAQALACMTELGLDPSRVNTCGGGIALGHPIGASGARLLVHLAHRIASGGARRALATLCVGGGMGAAVSLSQPVAGP
jgi:acetyl-CoA C-acetyltransferase